MGDNFMLLLQGIAIGHLFHFLDDTLPTTHNKHFVETPNWFLRFYAWSKVKILSLRGEQQQFRNEENVRAQNDQPRAGGFNAFGGGGVRVGGN